MARFTSPAQDALLRFTCAGTDADHHGREELTKLPSQISHRLDKS
jgi:hypothetical protein